VAPVTPSPGARGAPYLELVSVSQHLDALEALSARRIARPLATRPGTAAAEKDERRRVAHLRCLALRKEEALREASLRLRSPHFSAASVAASVLLALAPEQSLGVDGGVTLRGRRPLAIVRALENANAPDRPLIGDDVSVEAYSAKGLVSEGILVGHLLSASPRAGLIAASRAPTLPRWAERTISRIAFGNPPRHTLRLRPLALYALGRHCARAYGEADPGFAGLVDGALGDAIFEDVPAGIESGIGPGAALVAMSFVGHAATARRVSGWMDAHGPILDGLYAIGVLGIPRYAHCLIGAMSHGDSSIRHEAVRAAHIMTGRWFVASVPMPEDGRNLAPDRAAAEAFFRDWSERGSVERYHLGRPLRRPCETASPSFSFSRAVCTGAPRPLGDELMPGVFDGGPRRRASPFSIAPPVRVPDFQSRQRVTGEELVRRKKAR